MDVAVVIQGFRGKNGKFLPNEIAVANTEGVFLSHWILNAPYLYLDHTTCRRETNNRLTTNNHGIEWHDGDTEVRDALHNNGELCRNVRCIFIIGGEEAVYLQILSARETINLGTETDFRNNTCLQNEEKTVCYIHAMKNKMDVQMFNCALQTVLNIRNHLIHKKWEENTTRQCSRSENDDVFDDADTQNIDAKTPVRKCIFNIFEQFCTSN
ncbi:uncharacterized protein LOC107042308 [Diachasma alloeum]|uniref:uncharacterized protein LOC107042308 n=1 Tax=Diachasma alloeum TaxID=454923 RepID=UPI00073834B4|nr:uncharacterized protein LOC107042308 [Diachasma alloeum]